MIETLQARKFYFTEHVSFRRRRRRTRFRRFALFDLEGHVQVLALPAIPVLDPGKEIGLVKLVGDCFEIGEFEALAELQAAHLDKLITADLLQPDDIELVQTKSLRFRLLLRS